jgi:hypothetical protein
VEAADVQDEATDVTASSDEARAKIACSFCLKSAAAVQKMIAGPGVFICNECIDLCNDILAQEAGKPVRDTAATFRQRLSDSELLAHLPKVAATAAHVEQNLADWVHQARQRGVTWTRIGAALGMTRQSAWERFSGEE